MCVPSCVWLGGFASGNRVVACFCVLDIGVFASEVVPFVPGLVYGVFPPTNCSTHQFHSNEYIPLQAAFFFQLCSGHLLCLESQASLPGKLLLTLQSPVHPLRRSSHLQLPSADLSFPLRPPHFLHSWNEAALMLLVHLSCVFEARDCIRSQVYVYIPIRRLLMRVFQDVN